MLNKIGSVVARFLFYFIVGNVVGRLCVDAGYSILATVGFVLVIGAGCIAGETLLFHYLAGRE